MAGVQVDGAARCQATLAAASDRLGNLTTAAQGASRIVSAGGAVAAPRHTGALAMSVRPQPQGPVAQVVSTLRYSGFVHYGTRYMLARPFLLQSAKRTAPLWVAAYEADADRALGMVKGV